MTNLAHTKGYWSHEHNPGETRFEFITYKPVDSAEVICEASLQNSIEGATTNTVTTDATTNTVTTDTSTADVATTGNVNVVWKKWTKFKDFLCI